MKYFTVAVTHTYQDARSFEPAITLFTSKDAADSFRNDLECMYEKMGVEKDVIVTVGQADLIC